MTHRQSLRAYARALARATDGARRYTKLVPCKSMPAIRPDRPKDPANFLILPS